MSELLGLEFWSKRGLVAEVERLRIEVASLKTPQPGEEQNYYFMLQGAKEEIAQLKQSESDADALREIIDKYDRDLRAQRIENVRLHALLDSEMEQGRASMAEIERLKLAIASIKQ